MQCCGPSFCSRTKDEFVCQTLTLLPDFQGKLKPGGVFLTLFQCFAELVHECLVSLACSLEKEFNPCESEIYFDKWVEEYGLPFRCPLEGISAELEHRLLRLQICLQVQLQNGATFNQTILNQIADVLGITYTVKVPTYDLTSVSACDIIPMPASGINRCNPDGCVFQQGYIVCVQCVPSDAHIDVFKCFIAQLNPCHVTYCVIDESPNVEVSQSCCTSEVNADCVGLNVNVSQSCCDDTVEAD